MTLVNVDATEPTDGDDYTVQCTMMTDVRGCPTDCGHPEHYIMMAPGKNLSFATSSPT